MAPQSQLSRFGRIVTNIVPVLVAVGFMLLGGLMGWTIGMCLLAAFGFLKLALRSPRRDVGVPRRRGDVVVLPRRILYTVGISLSTVLLSIGLTTVGVMASRIEDYSGGIRGSAEILVVLAPPLALLGLALGISGAFGRGRVMITATGVSYSPHLGRTRFLRWVDVVTIRVPDPSAVVVADRRRRIVIATGSQRWRPTTLEAMLRTLRSASEEQRISLADEML